MKSQIYSIASDTNKFIKSFLHKQKKTELIKPIKYGLLPGGKKIRSKILIDVGKIFNVNYKTLIQIGSAVECIHAYSLIHDDLPCMDDDSLRRGKLSTHKKYGEATAILAGNSLLTIAFEILSSKSLKLSDSKKVKLIYLISKCSGHSGIAGGQYLDLNYEKKKVTSNKIINMQVKKTGMLFSFSCLAPLIIANRKNHFNKFNKIGADIGLLFQIADDLIDLKGETKKVGKKTKKDLKKGKATLISLLGYKKTIVYTNILKNKIFKDLKIFGNKAENLKSTISYILNRAK